MFPSGDEHIISGIGIAVIHECMKSFSIFGCEVLNDFFQQIEVID